MLRRASQGYYNRDVIGSLNPFERWNIDNLTLSSGTSVDSMNGVYNDISLSQTDINKQPDEVSNTIEFDSDDFLENISIGINFASSGEVIFVVDFKNISDVQPVCLYGSSTGLRALIALTTSDGMVFLNRNDNNLFNRVDAFTSNYGLSVFSVLSNGSQYKFYQNDPINDLSKTVVNGVDNGLWFDNQVSDSLFLGELKANAPTALSLKDITIFNNKTLTDLERTDIFNELKNKYSI